MPLFPVGPQDTAQYVGLDSDAHRFAQSFLCMSLNMSEIAILAELMLLNAPDVYSQNVSASTLATYPAIFNLTSGQFNKDPSCDFKAVGNFTVFAKSGEWDNGLWESCVAPTLQSG